MKNCKSCGEECDSIYCGNCMQRNKTFAAEVKKKLPKWSKSTKSERDEVKSERAIDVEVDAIFIDIEKRGFLR